MAGPWPAAWSAIARIAVLYTNAVQAAGIVATAKHFPGHSDLAAHPAPEDVTFRLARDHVERNLEPFQRLIDAGVGAVMVGPGHGRGHRPGESGRFVARAGGPAPPGLGFEGLIVSDDLDVVSTMKGRSLGEVAVSAVAAGVELLLIPGGSAVAEIAEALTGAVEDGRLSAATLARAAGKVRALADGSARRDLGSARRVRFPTADTGARTERSESPMKPFLPCRCACATRTACTP